MSKQLNDLFDYGYMIYQDSNYFKFSLDSVLLAEFTQLHKGDKTILDMCTGNAAVAMILQSIYGNKVNITAVELQDEIYELAKESIEYNHINNIELIKDDVKNYCVFNNLNYDIVVCNPPYFKVDNKELINDNNVKAIARHEIKLDLEDTIKCASKCIKNKGYFYMVHRPERIADIINILNKYNFGVKTIQTVYDKPNAKCSLVLIESIYNGENYVKMNEPIYLNNKKSYKGIFKGDVI